MMMLVLPQRLNSPSLPMKRAPRHHSTPNISDWEPQAKRRRPNRSRDDAGNDRAAVFASLIDPTLIDVNRITVVQEVRLTDFPVNHVDSEAIYNVLSPLLHEETRMMLQQPFLAQRQTESFAEASNATNHPPSSTPVFAFDTQTQLHSFTQSQSVGGAGAAPNLGQGQGRTALVESEQRQRHNPNTDHSTGSFDASDEDQQQDKQGARFHSYQSNMWEERFMDLIEFQSRNGHCLVPCNYQQNLVLARWVKRQRHQYKRKNEGIASTLSDDRQQRLQSLGFVWDTQKAVWQERFEELVSFFQIQGHCNVNTRNSNNNSKLIAWVKCQRRHFKLYSSVSTSSTIMCQERIDKLNSIGFDWAPSKQAASLTRK